ncbi:hypothetical protein P691DRAFT_33 [Macrolepiota fuliginosa MF-IS2]|uniref:Amino acid permease/ SLC12A domain-containing protein n=1 Tax=Macrolepiota fuliginosa MF-IS2 TaxID=1400762 RepID=A0A9P6C795_9AGAR|nr:hypothetical protein P691DRAFT_33 [Macrolepiota fuliginosa MF-IS2]
MDEKKDGLVTTYSPTELESSERHSGTEPSDGKLVRQLKNRHVAMISIGGVIGTGLFLGTATALQEGGPIGLLLGYIVMGSICYSVMVSACHSYVGCFQMSAGVSW